VIPQASILLLLLGIGACSHSEAEPLPEPLQRLEDLLLENPASPLGDWLLVGRYEVTREEFGAEPDASAANLPMVMVSYQEAEAWSQERGLRLPTLKEWQYLASDFGRSLAVAANAHNGLSLSLDRPLPVGVFERGRTSLGAYDFFGNVREWVSNPEDGRFFACGGSYASRDATIAEWEQLEMLPTERAADIGFRYVAGASEYFAQQVVPVWPHLDDKQRTKFSAIMSAWSPKARAALATRLLDVDAPKDLCQLVRGQ